MALNWQRPGINHVGEFQSSGHVLAVAGSGSPVLLNYVAKSITFTNAAVGVKVITLYDNGSNAASFNLAGDPIVHTVQDALESIRNSNIEYLYLPDIKKLIYCENKNEN